MISEHASLIFLEKLHALIIQTFFITKMLDSNINFKKLLTKIIDLKINIFENWILGTDMKKILFQNWYYTKHIQF